MSDYLTCGKPPKALSNFFMPPDEAMFFLCMPIKLIGGRVAIPERLSRYTILLERATEDFGCTDEVYIYITAKTMFVDINAPGNRPGWHIDGFGSGGDVNYIWSNMNPTEFAVQDFVNVSRDDQQSMVDISAQIDPAKIRTWPDCTLLRLDETVVHRLNPNAKPGFRSFVKLSFSRHQFNNAGNSHNYLLDYSWRMTPRKRERNLDHV